MPRQYCGPAAPIVMESVIVPYSPTPERVEAITYSEYPKWLQHNSRPPVIVNDASQEKIFIADGYFAPGCSDPEGYLLSKVTTKLDDAIRTMHKTIEAKLSTGLEKLSFAITEMIDEHFEALHDNEINVGETEARFATLKHNISDAVETQTATLAIDAMDAIRQIAKSTNSGG